MQAIDIQIELKCIAVEFDAASGRADHRPAWRTGSRAFSESALSGSSFSIQRCFPRVLVC